MGESTAANPLGLLLGEDGSIPQVRLTRLEGTESARRTAICTLVLDHLSEGQAEGIFFFNALHQQHQLAAILILEPGGTHIMVDAFVRAPENLRHAALFSASAHRSENAEIIYHEINLGVISDYISYRASVGGAERLGPAVAPGAAGTMGAAGGRISAGREFSGQYPPEFMARRMLSDDMKNAKTFLYYGPLSAATLETFDQ